MLRLRLAALGALLLAGACDAGAIAWNATAPNAAVTPMHMRGASTLPNEPRCDASVVTSWSGGDTVDVAYWSPRADSSVVLREAHSTNGGANWRVTMVDSSDTTRAGCGRIPPAVAGSGGNSYVVYSMSAPEGVGVFFSHAMDSTGLFHAPVPIVYGDHTSAAAIAVSGDRVAVAYEDPNSDPTTIGLAVSRTMGHLFEVHATASDTPGDATNPAVTLDGTHLTVSWTVRAPGDSLDARRVSRSGVLH